MFLSSRSLQFAFFILAAYCSVTYAVVCACFFRSTPFTPAECVNLCVRRYGVIKHGNGETYIATGILNTKQTKCNCRLTIGLNMFLKAKNLNPDTYSMMWCVNSSMANNWLKDKGVEISFETKRKPVQEIKQVAPGVFVMDDEKKEGTNDGKEGQLPPSGPISFITGLPAYLRDNVWARRPNIPMPTIDVNLMPDPANCIPNPVKYLPKPSEYLPVFLGGRPKTSG